MDHDINQELVELQERSDHYKFDSPGYIDGIDKRIEEDGVVVITVRYPSGEESFTDEIPWPKQLTEDTRLGQLVNHPDMPFAVGRFDETSLLGEAVPIEDEQIIVPPSRFEGMRKAFLSLVINLVMIVAFIVFLVTLIASIGLVIV